MDMTKVKGAFRSYAKASKNQDLEGCW